MVGVVVRQDDQREMIAGFLFHILNAVINGVDVRRMNAAIDQNVRGAVLSWHSHQEEIAEAHAVHPDANGACWGGSRASGPGGRLRCAPAQLSQARFAGDLRVVLRGVLAAVFLAAFAIALAGGHDQYSSCTRPKLAWKCVAI